MFCCLFRLLSPRHFNSSSLQVRCSIHEPGVLNSGVQCMNVRFFVSSAPPSTPQLLKSGVQCMNVQLLFSSAVTWTLQLTLCFLFPLLLPALSKSGDQGMSFRFFVSSAPRPTPQLLNSSTQLLKPGVRCSNVLPLLASAVTCILELRCSMYELSIFCLLCSTLSSPTPQLRCSMHGCSAPCFLCCHLDSSTHIVLLVSSAVTCTLELRCSMYELSIFCLLRSTPNSSTPQLLNSSTQLLKPDVRCRNVLLLV